MTKCWTSINNDQFGLSNSVYKQALFGLGSTLILPFSQIWMVSRAPLLIFKISILWRKRKNSRLIFRLNVTYLCNLQIFLCRNFGRKIYSHFKGLVFLKTFFILSSKFIYFMQTHQDFFNLQILMLFILSQRSFEKVKWKTKFKGYKQISSAQK